MTNEQISRSVGEVGALQSVGGWKSHRGEEAEFSSELAVEESDVSH